MVKKEVINQVIVDVLSNNVNKCLTIEQMREKLSSLTHKEQFEQLKEQKLLNPLEIDDYETLLNAYESSKEELDNPEMIEWYKKNDMYDKFMEDFEYIEKSLFGYGRRLIEGLTVNPIPDVNMDDFSKDTQYKGINDLLNKHGELEQKQIELQSQEFNRESVSKSERHSMDWYFSGDLNNLNKTIYGFTSLYGKHYDKKLNDEQKRNIKDIDKIVEISDELIEYDDFLPLFIRALIFRKWSKHLDKIGKYDEIIAQCIRTKPKDYDEAVIELVEWCKENNEYKDIILTN